MNKAISLAIMLLTAICAMAQVTVEARIDPIEMLIGQQAKVELRVVAADNANVGMPSYQPLDTMVAGVEVVSGSGMSKRNIDQGLAESIVTYMLTSFDANLYYLPPFKVKVDGKEYESKSLALKVIDVEVDTVNVDHFFGPKDVQDNPFDWNDWQEAFWLSVLMLVLGAGGVYFYLRLKADKPIIPQVKIVKRLLPHQKAMRAIEQIKADKMVQAENPKEYYTRLTEALRKYIEERYGFNAMEMTSGQIIERLTAEGDAKSISELRTLFQTADLVKFAKHSTLIGENDMNLVNAIEFINTTKREDMPTEVVQKPQLTKEQVRSWKERRLLKAVIAAVAVVCAGLLAYVTYTIYQLLG